MERKQYPYYEIGERLENLMHNQNISDSALAKRIGKNRRAILAYRHNESEMGIVTLMKICSVLGTTPNYLLYGKRRTKWLKTEIVRDARTTSCWRVTPIVRAS